MVVAVKAPTYFRRKLIRAIEPTGGPGAILETLEDCAIFMGKMHKWRQAQPHWDHAAELVLRAAKTGRRVDVDAAGQQMERALRCEGWL
jgi:hypothetical protein